MQMMVQPHRGQQSSAAVVVPKVGGAKPVSGGGRLNNAAEFAVMKLDDLVNWGRRVRKYKIAKYYFYRTHPEKILKNTLLDNIQQNILSAGHI